MRKQTTTTPPVYNIVHSGVKFPFVGFGPEHVRLSDIVHHLSMINRWNGGTSKPYSVLEHSLYCDELVLYSYGDRASLRVHALLHDAHEAYTGDYPYGLKVYCPFIKQFQDELDRVIYAKLGIEFPSSSERVKIKRIDRSAMMGEAKLLLPPNVYGTLRSETWKDEVVVSEPPILPVGVCYGEKRDKARNRYTNLLESLMERMNG